MNKKRIQIKGKYSFTTYLQGMFLNEEITVNGENLITLLGESFFMNRWINDNFNPIGYSTSPNFGNYNNLNSTYNRNMEQRNRDFGQISEENLLNSVSIFNKGGKRINADEYFKKLKDSLNDKRNIDPNEDMENYLMNGKNYIKDIKGKIQELNERKDN